MIPHPHPVADPDSPENLASAHRLLDETSQGAQTNDRSDLIRRLAAAHQRLDHTRDVAGAVDEALRALDSLATDLRSRRRMLADPARTARLRTELVDLRSRQQRLASGQREWPHLLGDGFATVESDVEFHLVTRVRAVLAEAEETLRVEDPDKVSPGFSEWLRERMCVEAAELYAYAGVGAQRVADRLGELLGSACRPEPAELAVSPARELVAGLPECAVGGWAGSSVSGRLLGILMPGYGGMMMALVGSRFVDTQLPGWIIGFGALFGALCLGGAALSGDRSRQLENRRATAAAGVRVGGTEEFQLAIGKQVRDALGARQRNLRGWALAELDQLEQALAAEQAGTGAAVETAERLPAELDDIADDLATIEAIRGRAEQLRGNQEDIAQPSPGPLSRSSQTPASTSAASRTARVLAEVATQSLPVCGLSFGLPTHCLLACAMVQPLPWNL